MIQRFLTQHPTQHVMLMVLGAQLGLGIFGYRSPRRQTRGSSDARRAGASWR